MIFQTWSECCPGLSGFRGSLILQHNEKNQKSDALQQKNHSILIDLTGMYTA
jgi:hypothetical protein